VRDRTFDMHVGGKIEVRSKMPLHDRDDLSMAYTPGVARVCTAIEENPSEVHKFTIKRNTVAIVTDGTAVLGLGDIGPHAALPVMEGKAMLFKEFAGIDAFPICLDVDSGDQLVETVQRLEPVFGGINLEDIAAPRCFEVEEKLKATLDIPVFHDDQHGTAVVVLAALRNALKVVDKRMEDLKVVIAGVGAAGVAITKILMEAGVPNVIGVDRKGAIYEGRTDLNASKQWLAEHTNPEQRAGALHEVIPGADLFVGVSGPGLLTRDDLRVMHSDPIVFALANPDPEITPEEAEGLAAVIATGRSDYANQINNVLCFPGIFRGALDAGAKTITEGMKLAAAEAIAAAVPDEELSPGYIVPSVFNKRVVELVAAAVSEAAVRDGVVR
jgi:malate dehydrogenase (oxaloacetate-decarboxylating)